MKTRSSHLAFIIPVLILVSPLFSQSRSLDCFVNHEIGTIPLSETNYGCFGVTGEEDYGLEYPVGSGVNYLYNSALWFGAKKYRLNEAGRRLYWLSFPPTDPDAVVAEGEEGWSADLAPVIDTLTTVGFEGDCDLYEMLPAYNALESSTLGDLYTTYNTSDVLMRSVGLLMNVDDDNDGLVDEDPLGSPWALPNDTYCFTLPFDDDGDGQYDEDGGSPGYETILGYCYDYSPFGTAGQRDWGSYHSSSDHQPLNIAVRQESFAFPDEAYKDMVFLWYTVTNMNESETLYDVCGAWYVDTDIVGTSADSDDICRQFISGDDTVVGAWDADFCNGEAPYYFGMGMIDPLGETVYWAWTRGDTPDDHDPLDITPSEISANEKYWLMTGRNPDDNHFSALDEQEYTENDIRFLMGFHGDQQGIDNPTDDSINLAPGESITCKAVIVMGSTSDELLSRYASACALAAGWAGYNYAPEQERPSAGVAPRCYPNPFNPQTTVAFSLPTAGRAELAVYNLRGQRVRTLVSGHLAAGEHTAVWNGTDDAGRACAGGVYFCRLVSGGLQSVSKMLLLK